MRSRTSVSWATRSTTQSESQVFQTNQPWGALSHTGFIYVVNFGLSAAEVDEQYDFAQQLFASPLEDKMRCLADLDKGEYIGYKPFGLREVKPGVPENTEVYNIPRAGSRAAANRPPPPAALAHNAARIDRFARHVHEHVVARLLALFALVLELPEDHFAAMHAYGDEHTSYLRYMKYHARTPAQNEALDHIWLKGHSDFGSLTLLFRQPIVALQVRTPGAGDGSAGGGAGGGWRYVRPMPESIIVNVADTLQFLSNGFFKSSIHRVVAPPADQAHLDRLGVIYFVRAGDDVRLRGAESPVLRREGLLASGDPKDELLAKEWVAARTIANISKKEVNVEEEKLNKIGAGLTPVYV